jgi:hypothetical protein
MLKKNISSDDIFLYVPKIEKKLKNSTSCLDMNEKLSTNNQSNYSNLGIKGSSTFDYLNDIKNKYNFPEINKSFLTNNLRNKKVLQNIENKSILSHKAINPLNKLRLSNSCELYHKLTKTFMNDKNCLKSVNNEDFLFEKEIKGFGEIFRAISYEELGAGSLLSRATAGIYRKTMIFAMPGSPNAVKTGLGIIIDELGHLKKHARK